MNKVEVLTYADEWLDNLINEVRPILGQIAKNTFERYREIGLKILKSGYRKGEWKSRHKRKFINELRISSATFSLFVRLAEVSEEEFKTIINTYNSVNEWYRKGKPKKLSKEREALISSLIKSFPDQAKIIREIFRVEKPYLKEKELNDFVSKVFYGKESPMDVFVKYYYLPNASNIRLPNWVLIGFKLWLEQEKIKQPVDSTILTQLRHLLVQNNILPVDIEEKAKLELKKEWMIV